MITTTDNEPQRLDVAAAERGVARSRSAAQNLIRAGHVTVNGRPVLKANHVIAPTDTIAITGSDCRYVGRGGIKLAAALEHFAIDANGLRCLDVGASTGGFTDCLLQAGAANVIAIDVGHNQMLAEIASDPRVDNREGINARSIVQSDFPHTFEFIVIDVSFISLTLVLTPIADLLDRAGKIVALIKPQFEVGAGVLGKGGLVRRATDRTAAVHKIEQFGIGTCGLTLFGTMQSPLEGGDGNIEYLCCFGKPA